MVKYNKMIRRIVLIDKILFNCETLLHEFDDGEDKEMYIELHKSINDIYKLLKKYSAF